MGAVVRCLPGFDLDVAEPTTIGLGDTFVDGFLAAVSKRGGHLGLGFDLALAAVERRGRSAQDVRQLVKAAGYGSSVLPTAADPYFVLERVALDGEADIDPGFTVLVMLAGEAELRNGNPIRLAAGQHSGRAERLRKARPVWTRRDPRLPSTPPAMSINSPPGAMEVAGHTAVKYPSGESYDPPAPRNAGISPSPTQPTPTRSRPGYVNCPPTTNHTQQRRRCESYARRYEQRSRDE